MNAQYSHLCKLIESALRAANWIYVLVDYWNRSDFYEEVEKIGETLSVCHEKFDF